MATTNKWVAPETIQSAHTTSLNSLANAAASAASAAIDNATDLYQYINVELALASLTPTGVPTVSVYIIYSSDGTNYDDTSASEAELLCVMPLSTGAGTKRVSRGNIPIRPLKFELFVVNGAGPAFASSGNTLKYARYNEQAV